MSLTSPEKAAARRRLYPGLAVAAVIAVGVTVAGLINGPNGGKDRQTPPGATGETIDPLAYRPALDADYEARAQELQVVGLRVVVGQLGDELGAVAPAAEARALALVVAHRAQRAAALRATGVERRVDVDEVERATGQRGQHRQVVGRDDQVVVELEGIARLEDPHRRDGTVPPRCR